MRQGDHAVILVGIGEGLLNQVKDSEDGGQGWVGDR